MALLQRRKPSRFSRGYRDKPLLDFLGGDLWLWGLPIALILLAGGLIASTQRQAGLAEWSNHWTTGLAGLVAAWLLTRVDLQRLRSLLVPLYLINLAGLVAVRFIGTTALGAQRWIAVGPFQLQPSEFAKLAVILLLGGVLARFPVERPGDLLRPFAVIIVPWGLVFLQPDLGTSLVFGALLLVMLFWSGMPLAWIVLLISAIPAAILGGLHQAGMGDGYLIALLAWLLAMMVAALKTLPWPRLGALLVLTGQLSAAAVTPWLWQYGLKDYQRDRLVLFLDPAKDPLGGGYHLLQSTIGIGSGGLFGTGLLRGHLTKLQFIPEQHTDFIFSALGEELGLLGCGLVLLAFGFWSWRLLAVADQARSDFESLVVVGILAMVMFQVLVNVSMTIGLGPVTGIPLPFLSYGRSALITNCLALGMVASVQRHARLEARRRL